LHQDFQRRDTVHGDAVWVKTTPTLLYHFRVMMVKLVLKPSLVLAEEPPSTINTGGDDITYLLQKLLEQNQDTKKFITLTLKMMKSMMADRPR
jgi:hypothetical protein